MSRTGELTSTLAAPLTVTVFSVSIERWLDQEAEQPLVDVLRATLGALRSVTAEVAPAGTA